MGKHTRRKAGAGPAASPAADAQRTGAAGPQALAALAAQHGRALHDVPGDNQCRAREHTALTLRHATLDLLCANELPALLDDSSDEDEPMSGVRIAVEDLVVAPE